MANCLFGAGLEQANLHATLNWTDGTILDVDANSGRSGIAAQATETVAERESREKSQGALLNKQGANARRIQETIFAATRVHSDDELVVQQREIRVRMQLIEEQEREAAFEKLQEEFDDETIEELQREVDSEVAEYQDLITSARASAEELADAEKAQRALEAMDRLLRDVKADKAKWAMVDQLSSGGAQAVKLAFPVVGLAVAVRNFIKDLMVLTKRTKDRNAWLENLAMTAGNSSVYGPAIQGRAHSATILVRESKVKAIIDALKVTAGTAQLVDATGFATGASIAANLAGASATAMFKLHKKSEVIMGWRAYLDARENPGNRKKARRAMRVNSTLSKCVLAYGAIVDKDPIAIRVAKNCGLTPQVLEDGNDICQKVVDYFETLYSDDPVVLMSVPAKKDWHPGESELTLQSWFSFKAAARNDAAPRMAESSLKTPAIDRALLDHRRFLDGNGSYKSLRDQRWPDEEARVGRDRPAFHDFLEESQSKFTALQSALESYSPQSEDRRSHVDMTKVVNSLSARVEMELRQIRNDLIKQETAQL